MLNVMKIVIVLSGCFTLAWMIYGSVVVFDDEAKLCKGDKYLPKSYKFCFVWLILLYCTVGLTVCCGCMFFCIVANNKKKK